MNAMTNDNPVSAVWVGMLPPAQKGQSLTIPRASLISGEEWRLKIPTWRVHGRRTRMNPGRQNYQEARTKSKNGRGSVLCLGSVWRKKWDDEFSISTRLQPHSLSGFHLHNFHLVSRTVSKSIGTPSEPLRGDCWLLDFRLSIRRPAISQCHSLLLA